MLHSKVHVSAGTDGILTLIVKMVSSILVYVETIGVVHEALRTHMLAITQKREKGDSLMEA